MRYMVIINDDEIVDNGGEPDVEYEVPELLRSGYYQVESIQPLTPRGCSANI